jgi:DNA-binding transcriptional LysR family regulator
MTLAPPTLAGTNTRPTRECRLDKLKCLHSFVQIARCASLASAAEQLGISRSLASEHLRQLEQHVGARLVTRTSRQLALTRIGEDYLALALGILKTVAEADSRVADLQNRAEGPIKLMASMAFATYGLGPVVTDFSRAHPAIRVDLQIVDRSFYLEEFIEGRYDLGVSTHPVKDSELISTKITDVAWVPCASPRYLRSSGKIRTPADLADHACLCHQRHAPDRMWEFISPRGTRSSVEIDGSFSTNSALVLRDAVLGDLGIAMLPSYIIARDVQQGRLVHVLPNWRTRDKPAYLIYPQMKHLPRRTRLFIDFLRDSFRRVRAE